MKSVLITFNQALREDIVLIFDEIGITGYTFFEQVQGRGTSGGEAHYGTHAWPTLNSSIITVVENAKVNPLLDMLKRLDKRNEMLGLRAFVWSIENMI
ncbi:MAG: PG0541 family transporter-associated protein [Bacteroidales bacterium]